MLLALDTATALISLALHDGFSIVAETTYRPARAHTVEAAPAVAALLEKTGTPRAQLSAVAVAHGPGTYSGLRVGVSLAKGLAAALGVPLVGVGTLTIAAAACAPLAPVLVAFMAAGRSRITLQTFTHTDGTWTPDADAANGTWADLVSRIEAAAAPPLLCGELDTEGRAVLADAQARGVAFTLAPAAARTRRAAVLADLVWALLHEAGDPAERLARFRPAALVPVYAASAAHPDP
jgi:tRNA threonylcarbamoyladenosine biosynthesis protein TsaB